MVKGNFFTKLFGFDGSNEEENEDRSVDIKEEPSSEETDITLQDVLNFVTELQSYYYNDICKMKTDKLVQIELLQDEIKFIDKKIKIDEVATLQIDEILELIKKSEREFQSVWKKSVYSFYDEIEKEKLKNVQFKVFNIILKLIEINTKQELQEIIVKRIESYRKNWKIDDKIELPKNYNIFLMERNDNIEKYQFGNYIKYVIANNTDKILTTKQLDQIRSLKFEFEEKMKTDTIWVYVGSASRLQVNYLRKTCIIKNDWEYQTDKDLLYFDIVNVNDLEQYLKGVLQIVLAKKTYSVISIVCPTEEMLNIIGPTNVLGEKVEICKRFKFSYRERSGIYKNNLITARIDRRFIPEVLKFSSYVEYRNNNF